MLKELSGSTVEVMWKELNLESGGENDRVVILARPIKNWRSSLGYYQRLCGILHLGIKKNNQKKHTNNKNKKLSVKSSHKLSYLLDRHILYVMLWY